MHRTHTIDLGPAPWGEACAQIGHTPNFPAVNQAEVAIFRAALIARYGEPPDNVRLHARANDHDFGRYYTLEAEATDELTEAATRYLDDLENGIERWHHAGFSPPDFDAVARDNDVPAFVDAAVRGALNITRPGADGTFFPEENATLNANLRKAFPASAAAATA